MHKRESSMTGENANNSTQILVTGASGYVGGRLVPRLLEAGYRVRAMVRSPEKLACRPWAGHARLDIVRGDMLELPSVVAAAEGCRAAFYLVHSMVARKKAFADADRTAALHMTAAADHAGIERIIYLGGLGDPRHEALSHHLRSRHEVERILAAGAASVTNLRAAMILGSGSASFEMLRYLVERLPVMTPPRWVNTPCQPIAIGNVLDYLLGCLEHPETAGQTYDIGGPDIVTYRDLIRLFAEEAGLPRRLVIPVPVLTPYLSAKWIHLVTPVPAAIAQPLAEGLAIPVVCRDQRILSVIDVKRATCRETIRRALDRVLTHQVDTCWSDAGEVHPPEWAACGDAEYAGGSIMSCGYEARMAAPVEQVWRPVQVIGGRTGWYHADLLWKIRGGLDRLAGGYGLRRGRRHPEDLRPGEALDFWRVLDLTPGRRLVLLAEMKVPGEATLTIEAVPAGDGTTTLRLLSRFLPRGLAGLVYWYVLYPFHEWVFSGMLSAMARAAGARIIDGPGRFTPRLHTSCRLPAANIDNPGRSR